MKLIDLKEWIESLPEEFLNYEIVNGEEGKIDEEYFYRVDKPIVSFLVDENTKEIVLLNQSQLTEDELKEHRDGQE